MRLTIDFSGNAIDGVGKVRSSIPGVDISYHKEDEYLGTVAIWAKVQPLTLDFDP